MPGPPTSDAEEMEARSLVERIMTLARAHDHRAILDIALDPETATLLDRLPERTTATARVHLDGALRWRAQRFRRNRERLDDVRRALDAYDLTLARGLLHRIDPVLVAPEDRDRFDALLLETEARALEAEELGRVARSLAPRREGGEDGRRRRWFGR